MVADLLHHKLHTAYGETEMPSREEEKCPHCGGVVITMWWRNPKTRKLERDYMVCQECFAQFTVSD